MNRDEKLRGRMTTIFSRIARIGLVTAIVAMAWPAAAASVHDKADTAFMFICTVLVLLMTIPGLAMFYAGLVRAKNVASIFAQVIGTVCLVVVLWLAFGYSLAFTADETGSGIVGGLSKIFVRGVSASSSVSTFSNGVVIPEYLYICFQMTFAAITPALMVGAFAERMKFSAMLFVVALWLPIVYCPMAHMMWYWAGPDKLADAASALSAATPGAGRALAEFHLAAVQADAGFLFRLGAIDFAGGTVVHINAGIAALVGVLVLGPRLGYGRESMPPNSLAMSAAGAALLWVGWFGFNCGSNLEANDVVVLALANTFAATASAGLCWMLTEWTFRGKPSLLGLISGIVAGLVAVTPASGFAHPIAALVIGFVSGVLCFLSCTLIKNAVGYDDTLDVFGIHCIGGIIGALGTGLVVDPALGGTGVADYLSQPGSVVAVYDRTSQILAQIQAVGMTLAWSGVGTFLIFVFVHATIGLRAKPQDEEAGLDITDHGETADYR